MSQFKDFKNQLHPEYLELKEQILHPNTVWFRQACDPVNLQATEQVWFTHCILARSIGEMKYPRPMSSLIDLTCKALTQILFDNGEGFEQFHRIAVNLTLRQEETYSPAAHEDHSFPYKHLLIYLNDSDGDTVMYNKKGQIIARSSPREDKVIHFGKVPHGYSFPMQHAERIVLVATYS